MKETKLEDIFFFIGTEAELIKIFPVIIECKKRSLNTHIIASGQNSIKNSVILKKANCGQIELELSDEKSITKSAKGLLKWWLRTYIKSASIVRQTFPQIDFAESCMVVHGDTVSTYMGARLGKRLGMMVCHVEAGLRSHNLLSPFPEEIDRLLTSHIARLHFAPGDEASNNLRQARGQVVNTRQNTLLDSLKFSRTIPIESDIIAQIILEDYFVFVMHRQENLVSKAFVIEVVREIEKASKDRKCVLLLHKITENTLIKYELMKELKANDNIIMIPRVEYFDFMKLLEHSQFVITDGGSNQEELFYMRKPCLILRTVTERNEGIGVNARLFSGHASDIGKFVSAVECSVGNGKNKKKNSPSEVIAEYLNRQRE